jgi:Protein of unknown function (DUF1697)
MQTFVALMHGINMGSTRKVPMADPRALCLKSFPMLKCSSERRWRKLRQYPMTFQTGRCVRAPGGALRSPVIAAFAN